MHNKLMSSTTFRAVLLAVACGSFALVAGCSANDGGGSGAPIGAALSIGSFSQTSPAVQGSTTSFGWKTSGSASCFLTGAGPNGFSDRQPASGDFSSSTTSTSTAVLKDAGVYTYTLSCLPAGNGSGTTPATSTQTINVPASGQSASGPAINTFGANPNPATPGAQVTFSWTTTGASSCQLVQGTTSPQTVATSGSQAVTAPAQAGTYPFTLTCATTAGGATSSTYPLIVQSSGPTPPPVGPTITGFSANPQTVNIGQDTTLSWSTNDATACTLAGADPYGNAVSDPNLPKTFTGADSPTGGVQTSAYVAGVAGVAKNGTGIYTYTLTCQDANGTSKQTTQVYVVSSGAPTITITPLTAQPVAILEGAAANTSVLTWNHPEAITGNSACSLGGTDPNGQALTGTGFGPQPSVSPSGGVTTPAQTVVGTYKYQLTCTNAQTNKPETADQAQVVVVDQSKIIQPLTVNFNEVTSGDTVNLTWNHPAAASCSASEIDPNGNPVTGAGAFTGSQPVSMLSSPFTTGALDTVGNYKFSLVCTNADGSTNAVDPTVTVTVQPQNAANGSCGPAQIAAGQATPLLNTASGLRTPFTPTAKAYGLLGGGLLPGLMGQVTDLANVVDPTATTPATITVPVGLLGGGESVTVTNVAGTVYPGGTMAGMVIQVPNQGLGAGVLQSVTINTLLNGTVVDTTNVTASQGGGVKLKALPGLVNSNVTQPVAYAAFLVPPTTPTSNHNYNAIQVKLAGVLNVLNQLSVYYACVAQAPATTP